MCTHSTFKFVGGWKGIYATIPVFSALINMATNKLAVWMIFSPLEFKGEIVIIRSDEIASDFMISSVLQL